MRQRHLAVLVALIVGTFVGCALQLDSNSDLDSSELVASGSGSMCAATITLKLVNSSSYDVTVTYKDGCGTEQMVRVRAGSMGSVSDFGGGTVSYSPSDSVDATRVDDTGKTTITFKDKSTGSGSGSGSGSAAPL